MSRAKVEIINEEVKIKNFEDLECGTVFEYEGQLYLKLDNGYEAVALANDEYLGNIIVFNDDDLVIPYDKAIITIRTRAE